MIDRSHRDHNPPAFFTLVDLNLNFNWHHNGYLWSENLPQDMAQRELSKKKRRTRGALDLKMNCVLNVTTRQLTANQNDALIESHTDYFIYLTFTQKWWKHKYSQKQSHASSFKSYNGNNLLLEVRKEKAGKKPEAQRDQLSWFRNRHKKLADENHQDSGVVS